MIKNTTKNWRHLKVKILKHGAILQHIKNQFPTNFSKIDEMHMSQIEKNRNVAERNCLLLAVRSNVTLLFVFSSNLCIKVGSILKLRTTLA